MAGHPQCTDTSAPSTRPQKLHRSSAPPFRLQRSSIIYRCSLAPTIRPLWISLVLLFPVPARACLVGIPPDAYARCPLSRPHAGCNKHIFSFRRSSSLFSESSIRPGRAEFRPGPILVYLLHIHWCFLSCADLFANMCSPSPYSSFHSTCARLRSFFISPLGTADLVLLWPDPANAAHRGVSDAPVFTHICMNPCSPAGVYILLASVVGYLGYNAQRSFSCTNVHSSWPSLDSPCIQQVNNEVKQSGCIWDMLSKVPALVEHVSSIVSLEVGSSHSSSPLFICSLHNPRGGTC